MALAQFVHKYFLPSICVTFKRDFLSSYAYYYKRSLQILFLISFVPSDRDHITTHTEIVLMRATIRRMLTELRNKLTVC